MPLGDGAKRREFHDLQLSSSIRKAATSENAVPAMQHCALWDSREYCSGLKVILAISVCHLFPLASVFLVKTELDGSVRLAS